MTNPYHSVPAAPNPRTRVHAGRLWAGGLATALVAGLIATTGILIARGLFGIPVLAPQGAGVWGDVKTARYVGQRWWRLYSPPH